MTAWEDFEEGFAKELGLSRVPGSGSQWHSKLDVHGRGARWELKFRSDGRFTVTKGLLDKIAADAAGMGSAGEIPLMAIRFEDDSDDYILMRKNDFLQMQAGELVLTGVSHEARAQRKKRAATPVLLRDEDAGSEG